MTDLELKGRIQPLHLVEVFAAVLESGQNGVLKVAHEGVQKAIYIFEGNIVFARSNLKRDRLGDILLAQGQISQEQYDEASVLIHEKGYRHGRALVEINAISPKLLWTAIGEQIKSIANSIMEWDNGDYVFLHQELKQKENITLRLPILNFLVDTIRTFRDRSAYKDRYPDRDLIYVQVDFPKNLLLKLEPHEEFILKQVDGSVSLNAICRDNDLGVEESLRVIFLLETLGMVASSGEKSSEGQNAEHPVIGKYNRLYAFINEYLTQALGQVGSSLLRKYFDGVSQAHKKVFDSVEMRGDGRLNELELQMNLNRLPEGEREFKLEEALDELLCAGILAVKKTLGNEHETQVLKEIEKLSGA